jgi:hypothetical protein
MVGGYLSVTMKVMGRRFSWFMAWVLIIIIGTTGRRFLSQITCRLKDLMSGFQDFEGIQEVWLQVVEPGETLILMITPCAISPRLWT